jgi:cytochrome c oxidase subunit 2
VRYFWIALFAAVPLASIALFLWAPGAGRGFWMPESITKSADEIDSLFFLILGITGVVFILVQIVFVYFLWKYGGEEKGKGTFTHGNHTLETVWTIVPAAILAFLAFYQFGAWKDMKFRDSAPGSRIHARVLGGQFEWRVRYPFPDVQSDQYTANEDLWRGGELERVNELHTWVGNPTLLRIQSRDVLHSFFIPAARLKQDLVPGMEKQVMWFTPEKAGEYEIACAELCGWGHYKMKGLLTVHESKEQFDAWFRAALEAQNVSQAETN